MIKVLCEYVNASGKNGKDYFIFTNIEVQGHADHLGIDNNTKVCAGISAICVGVRRLIDEGQFFIEYRKGYFHCYTERVMNLRQSLDRDSVFALNTLVCQLYELYELYPRAFKKFDLVDIKERLKVYEKDKSRRNQKPYRQRRTNKLGIYSSEEDTHFEEN